MPPVDPETGISRCLTKYDEQFQAVNGDFPTDYVIARMAMAQAAATMALVHAVRSLTATIARGDR